MCLNMLRAYGVTAVLNAAQGEMSDWNYINTKASYYAKDNIRFLGVPAFDSKTYPIRCAHNHIFPPFYHIPNPGAISSLISLGIPGSIRAMLMIYFCAKIPFSGRP